MMSEVVFVTTLSTGKPKFHWGLGPILGPSAGPSDIMVMTLFQIRWEGWFPSEKLRLVYRDSWCWVELADPFLCYGSLH